MMIDLHLPSKISPSAFEVIRSNWLELFHRGAQEARNFGLRGSNLRTRSKVRSSLVLGLNAKRGAPTNDFHNQMRCMLAPV